MSTPYLSPELRAASLDWIAEARRLKFIIDDPLHTPRGITQQRLAVRVAAARARRIGRGEHAVDTEELWAEYRRSLTGACTVLSLIGDRACDRQRRGLLDRDERLEHTRHLLRPVLAGEDMPIELTFGESERQQNQPTVSAPEMGERL